MLRLSRCGPHRPSDAHPRAWAPRGSLLQRSSRLRAGPLALIALAGLVFAAPEQAAAQSVTTYLSNIKLLTKVLLSLMPRPSPQETTARDIR